MKGIKEWNPSTWANLFKKAGARYVVLTSKHHDGFTLWPSDVPNPYRSEEHTKLDRDIVGELGHAVRHAGMRYGLYYSGGLDWSFPGKFTTWRKNFQKLDFPKVDFPKIRFSKI